MQITGLVTLVRKLVRKCASQNKFGDLKIFEELLSRSDTSCIVFQLRK